MIYLTHNLPQVGHFFQDGSEILKSTNSSPIRNDQVHTQRQFFGSIFQGDLHLIVPYTQRRLTKITQGDGDEDSNREHLPRILLLPGVSIECNTWSFMLLRNQTTQLHFEINIIYSLNNFLNRI